ncbi:MAG: DinB family protein, partial [Terriglobales bacterium]
MHAPTPEFLLTYRDMMIAGLDREVDKTRKVLAAVPDAKRDYRPEPCARTAWDLAWHIASSDVHFLDGIADLKFNMTPADDKPKTTAE